MKYTHLKKHFPAMITVLTSCVISACGGGSASPIDSDSSFGTKANVTSSVIATAGTKALAAVAVDSLAAATTSPPVTKVEITNTAAGSQSNVPVTFGQVFRPGEIPAVSGLALTLSNGSNVPFQFDIKARHADGSLRHGIFSFMLSQLDAGKTENVLISKTAVVNTATTGTTPTALLDSGFSSTVQVSISGVVFTASADAMLRTGKFNVWLSGPLVNEWHVSAPLKTSQGIEHPHLTARFAIRSYTGTNKAQVDVIIENSWAYEAAPQNFAYDLTILVGAQEVYSQSALTHYHHSRWRKSFWWGAAPAVHVKHDPSYLIASGALPNYDTTIKISATALTSLYQRWTASKNMPLAPGLVTPAMPMVGGRPDIGPLPQWSAMYLLSMDSRAKHITLESGNLAGSWPVHYRDKKTDQIVSLADYPYMTLLGRSGDATNPATGKSELFPACGGNCSTLPYNYNPDSAHQPSLAYLPYIVTGDYYYLEELQFWANWNMLRANPHYREFGKGLVKWDEVRGQAWSMRTLGQTAYITPDNHPMKKYFVERLDNNLVWYNTTYVQGNPNQFGVLDGSGKYAFRPMAYATASGTETGLAPWQDDFFTWSTGFLAEMGYLEARPLLQWKAKFPVGRMTAPGYCWIDGAAYAMAVRPNSTAPLYTSFKDAYLASMRNKDGTPMTNSTGALYLEQPCSSQAQADWRTQRDKDNKVNRGPWIVGEMDGYATSPMGYPANMQPALAVASKSGIPNAVTAWNIFANRSLKPNYSGEPQWAIVPRN